jgi:hypothetical protein
MLGVEADGEQRRQNQRVGSIPPGMVRTLGNQRPRRGRSNLPVPRSHSQVQRFERTVLFARHLVLRAGIQDAFVTTRGCHDLTGTGT